MMSNQTTAAIAVAVGLLFAAPTFAQVDLETQPVAAGAMETNLEGEVMVVNPETRLMTLKLADGSFEVLHVPPEVKRLDQIKIGDMVSLTETTTSVIELQSGRDAGAMGAMGDTEVEREPGRKPAGSITDSLTLYGKIVGIDKAAGTVTIKGAEATRTFPVQDRALLDEAKVGDGVVARFRNVISGEVTVK
jgi:Cu/Ag efflux protein CusF